MMQGFRRFTIKAITSGKYTRLKNLVKRTVGKTLYTFLKQQVFAAQTIEKTKIQTIAVQRSELGVNISGFITSELGIGEGVRSTIRAIESVNIPLVINNFNINPHRKLDNTYKNFTERNPYPINIIQINAPEVNTFLSYYGSEYCLNRYNIGFWAWELPEFPSSLSSAFNLFNEIWTPSSFCADAIAPVSPVPVLKMMHSISLKTPTITREMLGLPKNKFIFLFVFDLFSVLERKNPIAIIQAFNQAFDPLKEDVFLILKFSNTEHFPEHYTALKQLTEDYPSIQLIDHYLLKEEVDALIYNCDCYISLHRSEGFGLTMAEAMFYGKPVIATAYSANTEFMHIGNSFLVKYDLISLTEDFPPYLKGNVWAEPDIDHAAYQMRYVFEHYEQALKIGFQGSNQIKSYLSPQAVGSRMKKRLDYIIQSLQ